MSEVAISPTQPEASEEAPDLTLTLCYRPELALWQQASTVEAQVFIDSGYVENAEELQEEYLPYLPKTRMLAAQTDDKVVGAMRIINYDPKIGLKTVNDADKGLLELSQEGRALLDSIDPNEIVEVGTIALDPDYRGKSETASYMISSLYGSIYGLTLQENTPNIIASFDKDYFERFSSLFGPSVAALGPPTEYMGSETVPVLMNVDRLKEHFVSINAEAYVDSLTALGARVQNEY